MNDKQALRRSLLQTRQSLTQEQWQMLSQQLCLHLAQTSQFQQAQTILAYFSVRQEPDLRELFPLPKTWGFPRCVGKALVWHHWSPGDEQLQDRYGIPVPRSDAPQIEPQAVDMILVPAVACDRRGYRLGYGGGFYDRLFSDPVWTIPCAIGITFSFAYLPELPHDPWDKPLSGVCTELGIIFC